ncbi:YolD-like family protein [Lachnospiraceae bacterium OttesenSCG-928-D06]|nr:YolD-like family protein [Lachnospiraceae bacterium OttesenSCG-928-D06]
MADKNTKMDRADRAKQFMPFDALKGFREALEEKERIIVEKRHLSQEEKEKLDRILGQVKGNEIITVHYFQKGEYVQITGMVSKIDKINRILKIVNTRIPFDDISDLILEK